MKDYAGILLGESETEESVSCVCGRGLNCLSFSMRENGVRIEHLTDGRRILGCQI